jgi:predicted DsbA family dithiol-disulfide isomerase
MTDCEIFLLTLFSDFTCPYSYVTEAALRQVLAEGGEVEVRYRALELYPASTEAVAPADEEGWEVAVRPMAEALGLTLSVPGFRPRTRKAHEAATFATERGLGDAMRKAIFAAYWGEERDIGRVDVLMELVERLGVDPTDLKIALDIDLHARSVTEDEELARRLRVPGSPTLFIGTGPSARVLVGAQDRAALDEAIRAR